MPSNPTIVTRMGLTSIVLLLCLSRVLSDESRALLAPETDSPEFWTLADMWRDRSRFKRVSRATGQGRA